MWSKVTISTDGDSEGGVHLKKKTVKENDRTEKSVVQRRNTAMYHCQS